MTTAATRMHLADELAALADRLRDGAALLHATATLERLASEIELLEEEERISAAG